MRQQFEDQVTLSPERRSEPKLNGAEVENTRGELLHFAQLARQAAGQMEIEKSLREVALKINQARESERLLIGTRLHELLSRSLSAMTPNPNRSELPKVDRDNMAGQVHDVPPAQEYACQVRALVNLVYPAAGADQSLLSRSSPFSIV